MNNPQESPARTLAFEEKAAPRLAGMPALLFGLLLLLALTACTVLASMSLNRYLGLKIFLIVVASAGQAAVLLALGGLTILKPNEACVLTLLGKYHGTLRGPGFFWVNPFASAFNPAHNTVPTTGELPGAHTVTAAGTAYTLSAANGANMRKKLSLKSLTLNNNKQKINDQLGNPVEIGIVVIWRVVNTAMAVFNVDNYKEYLSIQCDSALRNIVSQYPYDLNGTEEHEQSLRGSSHEIAGRLQTEIQEKVRVAGLEILEARITHLAYAPEIAAVMLQRQQAAAIIDARQMIVEGAVGMVEMALSRISENGIVELDEERKAAMVSNLLVVLCGNKDAQPIVNSGSLY
jgi:regulator of protease activity HflC (stomatin/prohibitin superfamily)